jgi:hypothetical protein
MGKTMGSACYVDTQVASQAGVRVLTFVILGAGIDVTIIVIFGIVVCAGVFHDYSP